MGYELGRLEGCRKARGDSHDHSLLVAVRLRLLERLAYCLGCRKRRRRYLVFEALDDFVRRDIDTALVACAIGIVDAQWHDPHVVCMHECFGSIGSAVAQDRNTLVVHGCLR